MYVDTVLMVISIVYIGVYIYVKLVYIYVYMCNMCTYEMKYSEDYSSLINKMLYFSLNFISYIHSRKKTTKTTKSKLTTKPITKPAVEKTNTIT